MNAENQPEGSGMGVQSEDQDSTESLSSQSAMIRLRSLGYVRRWTYESRAPAWWRRRQVIEAFVRRTIRMPSFICIKEVAHQKIWALYFVFSPDGVLTDEHRYSLGRLRAQGLSTFVIVASRGPEAMPPDLMDTVDALYWKDMQGYDFSAYGLGLKVLARKSRGCSVLVMNDSVLGPISDILDAVRRPPWDLTGFSASGLIEDHLQSYAFVLRDLHMGRLRQLSTVFFPWLAFRDRDDVILGQETRLARVAASGMSVGSYWYLAAGDPTQVAPLELVSAGFPFVKKSLVQERSPFPDKIGARILLEALIAGESLS